MKVCREQKKGIFILVKTSNPSSGEFQDRLAADDDGQTRPLYELVGKKVDEWASDPALIGKSGYSEVGAVVGAFIMGILNNGMSLFGWSTDIQKIVKGAVLLGAVTFDVLSKRKKS